jgi:hypothetical protein
VVLSEMRLTISRSKNHRLTENVRLKRAWGMVAHPLGAAVGAGTAGATGAEAMAKSSAMRGGSLGNSGL